MAERTHRRAFCRQRFTRRLRLLTIVLGLLIAISTSTSLSAAARAPFTSVGTSVVATTASEPVPAVINGISGGGTWAGVVSLSPYPCTGNCPIDASDFTGYFSGTVTATSGSTVYTATWPGGTSANLIPGGISYHESCGTVAALPPDSGTASGPFTITGGDLLQNGMPDGSATLAGWLDWGRTEAGVIITVSSVVLENGSGTTIATAQGVGTGVGVFGAPIPPVGSLPPNCTNEEPVMVVVAGSYAQPS